jgi:AcrR family transcriptional regulator
LSISIQKAELKQKTIVQAAETLFLQQGYGVTSMDSIALQAGVTKQTVYRYFESKEALFIAVMQGIRVKESAVYTFSSGPVNEELMGYGSYLLAFHLQPSALGLYRLMLTEGSDEKLMNTFINTGPKFVMQPLIVYLQEHYPTLDEPEFAAQMFITMALAPRNKLLMSGKSQLKKSAQKAHIEKVVQCFIKMIAP